MGRYFPPGGPGPPAPGQGSGPLDSAGVTIARLRPPENRVSPRAVHMWTLGAAIGSVIGAAVLSGAAFGIGYADWDWAPAQVTDNVWWGPVAFAVYATASTIISPRWRYRVHRWEVTEDVIYTRTGWINRQWQLVPVNRIQTVDHTQGWMERLFKVATLEVQTASHAGSSTIEGLDAADAQRISEDLAARAGQMRNDAT